MVKSLQTQQGPKTVMITWLLLVLLFCESTQDEHGKESGVSQCGPQSLDLTGSDQTILATWEDDPSCSAVRNVLIYEVVVLTDQEVHHEEVVVMLDQIGSTHSWNWTSSLPLECVSFTVKIRSKCKNHTSPWMQRNLPGRGASSQPQVYPKNKRLAVNSNITFCCILPAGETFDKMYLTGYNSSFMRTRKISDQTYALTVLLYKPSNNTCTDVYCVSTSSSRNAACAWISYPPLDRDLQCETRDMETVDCYWSVTSDVILPPSRISTKYQLNGRKCLNGSKQRCSLKVKDEAGEKNWTLTAQNEVGKVELTDRADLMERVHMLAPKTVYVSAVTARNVTLKWKWGVQRYHHLDITCQINVSHGETSVMSEASGVGLRSAVVVDLTPNWNYNVTLQCGTTQHWWKWSEWSTSVSFHTHGDIPDAVDVWMQMKDNKTFVVWKELQADQSHGDILGFEVRWAKTTEPELQSTILTKHNNHSVGDPTEEYIVTVMARNSHGSSSPSTIIIPRLKPDKTTVNTSRISGSIGGFDLSWSGSPAASCGYIVDWCPTSGSCTVEWLKVSADQTNARITSSKNFRDGQRYTLSVFACTHTAPLLLERREGYIKEQKIEKGIFEPLQWKQQDSNVEVSWKPVPLRNQSAFIVGYVLYCEDNFSNKIVCQVSTDDPEATSLRATNLKISTYNFTVLAKTAAGECGASSFTATLKPLTDNLIEVVTISLVFVFGLLSLVTILCYRSWPGIKHKVYPPIPKPVLTDKWITAGDNICHLNVDQYLHSEADIMDVPELLCKLGAPVDDYVIQENLPYVSAQALKSYYNQSVKNCSTQPLSLPPTAVSPQSGLPTPPFKSLFPNPSYDLTMEMEYQPCSSSPESEDRGHSLVLCDGYQPQTQTTDQNQTTNLFENQTEECTDRPLSCVFTYVLLPQPTTT